MTFAPDLSGTSMGMHGQPVPKSAKKKEQLSEEQLAMRDYAVGEDGRSRTDGTVLLHVSHSNLKNTFFHELRLDMHSTVEAIKRKLEFHTGTSAVCNQLFLLDEDNQVLAECEDGRKLGFYSPYDGCRLHIVDADPNSASAGGWLEDVSLVKKYEISEESYDKRENTYRNFRKKKMQEDPNWTYKADLEERQGKEAAAEHLKAFPQPSSVNGAHTRQKVEDESYMEEEAANIKVSERCQVSGGRRGEVMFVGRVPELPLGFWVGVKYDEPVGKNDGSIKGARYFECLEKYGGFVRPDMCEVGDFPEEDPFADLDEM
eukprot:CAMPEP_0179420726 /NCGR_PEP_ID=MMETSP0799-20121207/9341_1 /TAXON_ID=46947 /ORGANISM="Geminigera cryophila, Strain CCMP2564" /LENGTH=315 /DNA_ID=CAMNT_0021194395 /DNA_START=49 /DNA_END=996 /DNA_ORIENTATION=+